MRKLVVAIASLAVMAIAGPAAAQENIEGFTLEECVSALAANAGYPLDAAQLAELDALNVTGATPVREVFEALFGDGLELVVAEDITLDEVCSIYGVSVLPIVLDRGDGDGNGDGGEVGGVIGVGDGNGVPTTEVRGVAMTRPLAVTGTDVILLVLLGAGVLGLGYVALRRTRDQAA